jgi:hypothetical protein
VSNCVEIFDADPFTGAVKGPLSLRACRATWAVEADSATTCSVGSAESRSGSLSNRGTVKRHARVRSWQTKQELVVGGLFAGEIVVVVALTCRGQHASRASGSACAGSLPEHQIMVSENEPQATAEDIQPVVSFV